ncbi:TPA: multidrug effflux MFS transporter, partial [Klebsiella pneumoniae]
LHLPVLALVGLFFTVSLMSGISTVAGAEAMSAVDAAQSGTASALMGTLMFVFGGIAAPLAGLGGETMLKMSLAMAICYLLALLLGLSKPRDAR